jgi:prolyl-tRNA synthetase
MSKRLTDPKINLAEWYQEVIHQAELADNAPVRGCIVIRPYGCEIWETIKAILDKKIKDTGHKNAMFPLLIPESYLKKEADHVEGFAPEIAVVTHAGGKKLAEPLVVRPTSETIIHSMFAQWIRSYRDLPLLINQWANVVRWEMRPRAFLRTTEFFWQEGHTAHATEKEALDEVLMMLSIYKDLAENYLAIPVITGKKSEGEKFPGAVTTYTFEGFMPDGKALQMGTSHLLSQSFAQAFEMQFQTKEGDLAYPWLTSWGTTTRLVGALVMTHGDIKGLVLPPRIAPIQVVIIPIYKTEAEREEVLSVAQKIKEEMTDKVRVFIDEDEQKTPGSKFYHWEMRGVPLRLEIGPRDVAQDQAIMTDRLNLEKVAVPLKGIGRIIFEKLTTLQNELLQRAKKRLETMKVVQHTLDAIITASEWNLIQTGFCGSRDCEAELKKHKLSVRCLIQEKSCEKCSICQKPSQTDCIVARSY